MSARDERLARLLEGTLTERELLALREELAGDPAAAAELAELTRLDRLLRFKAYLEREQPDLVAGVRQRLAFSEQPATVFAAAVKRRLAAVGPRRQPRVRRSLVAPLAAAAVLLLCGYGVYLWQAGTLSLRVAAVQGTVLVTRAGRALPATVRLKLRDGDRVAVPEGGQAALQYDGEDTRLALHSATATFRAAQGAKRVKLDSGLLLCTAAPQKMPFRLETPHAVAEVVGTRFWLETSVAETTLAVKAGKVTLRQQEQRLEVTAGETAVAAAAGMRKLSPADGWLRELLVQAETGPWDAVNLGTGAFAQDAWRLDTRGSPAARRLWNVRAEANRASIVVFDQARWQRGVIVGRLTILPEGEPPRSLAVPAAANPQWTLHYARGKGPLTPPSLGVLLFTGRREKAEGASYHLLIGDVHPRGVEHRCVVYFDLAAPERDIAFAAWPAARGYPPPAADWTLTTERTPGPVGLGLAATDILMLAEGFKLVPLGPDLPPAPPELRRAPHR